MSRSRSSPAGATASVATALPAGRPRRLDRLDALRGAAMLWMAAFHFSFDLHQFGLIPPQNFYADPVWVGQRLCIVTLFVALAGVGQSLAGALAAGPARAGRWRRWAQVAACAALVSAGSYAMFPRSFIFYGVLHSMAVDLLVLWGLAALADRLAWSPNARRTVIAVLAVALMMGPWVYTHPFFDSRWTTWIGLGTHKPVTEDFAPVMPWAGVFLLGVLAGEALRAARGLSMVPAWARWWEGPLDGTGATRPMAALAVLGRWPLSFYMLHQPVLIGLVQGFVWLRA